MMETMRLESMEEVGVRIEVEISDDVYHRYQELCADLNLDGHTKDITWQNFASVRQKYTLEGDPAHWLCCAVYVACRQASVPSVGPSAAMHGSYVNLTRLLRSCGLSLVEFFDKSRKWSDMTNLPTEFRSKVERLERNFAVTTVIFKKFEPIFAGLFKDFSREEMEENRAHRKKNVALPYRLTPKGPADLFEFCWTLFLCVKSSLRISDDLVNSYHLLLSCVDLVFVNVVHANRRNLLTPKFLEMAENGTVDSRGDPVCIIHELCDLFDGISVEAKTIKEFWLRPKIKNMIEQGVLRGESDTLTGLIDEDFFENNLRKIEKEYEEYVLTEGDFDERMYLSPERQAEIGMESQYNDFMKSLEQKTYPPLHELRHLMPSTPLSGRKYLCGKDDILSSPISTATQTVSRLQAILSGRKAEPTDALKELLVGCPRNPIPGIEKRLTRLSDIFCHEYASHKGSQPGLHAEFALYRSQLAQTLYYRLMENILTAESKLKVDKGDLNEILEEDSFNVSLFACSLEIVLFSYNSQRRFPWILEIFDLPAYHFFKVIEIVVRAEENLSRDVVKHLSQVEEKVLEELAWKNESPLWEALKEKGEKIPSCDEVFLPSQMEKTGTQGQENQPKRYAVIKTPAGEKCVPVTVGNSNQSTLIIQDKTSSQILGVVLPSKHGDKPKRGNSVALFFRKFYHVAYVRLQDMCKNLGVEDDVLRKIWTCFQQTIVDHVEDMMKSRHMDQIIMCCVYVVSKVVGKDKSFTDIMRCYRLQPQSASHVYRNVLLRTPEERGDLIKFYNTIFIEKNQKFAMKFSHSNGRQEVTPMSPVPHLKCSTPISPVQKIANKHQVFVRPLQAPKTPSPAKQYSFGSGHAGDLRDINKLVQVASANKNKTVKRILTDDDGSQGDQATPSKVFAKRLQEMMDDRPVPVPATTVESQ